MLARCSILGVLTLVASTRPTPSVPRYSLTTWGAISLATAGNEARLGLVPMQVHGRAMLMLSLGANDPRASLMIYLPGDRVPAPGRYRIGESWDPAPSGDLVLHATLVAGSPERPTGWFEGEAGWVTIGVGTDGAVTGEFEISARGFLGVNPDDEGRRVTVRGSFQAERDRLVAVRGPAR